MCFEDYFKGKVQNIQKYSRNFQIESLSDHREKLKFCKQSPKTSEVQAYVSKK